MEENKVILDKDTSRVLDILEQIKKLNGMIELHKNESDNDFMLNQYQDMKLRFLEELKGLLSHFEIDVLIRGKVA